MEQYDEQARAVLDNMFHEAFGSAEDDGLLITLKQIVSGNDQIEVPEELLSEECEGLDETNMHKLIGTLGIPQKIKLALFGNKVARGLLIRDPNRQVALFVLQNNRIRETEVIDFAKNINLDEQVHRNIARNPSWMKTYEIKLAIVSNPKVPLDVAMKFVKHLHDKDLKKLSKAKSIPSAVATLCRKIAEKRAKKG